MTFTGKAPSVTAKNIVDTFNMFFVVIGSICSELFMVIQCS